MQDRGDFAHGEFFVVIEGEDFTLAVCEFCEQGRELIDEFVVHGFVAGNAAAGVFICAVIVLEKIDGELLLPLNGFESLTDLGKAQSGDFGKFLFCGSAAGIVLDGFSGHVEAAYMLTLRAGEAVLMAQFIEH